ncbi:ABC transporter ATP-binding protein [Kyrpidia tusciae]|uniref:ABC transporter related protein n=1 Tax=Kyrpidia tusciae (strain DSM 2912 / NBRC 15312 / T2) TaxID=562970 RepID=D5WRX6_KYRT2|nr:ABC transporter ATP-binding protein [Kyrpidia tusciae]ADG06928.1 ABC transporter related protein [Kyrpidia tusciae DSM 2912]
MAQIEVRGVFHRYFTMKEETEALRNVHLQVEAGEFVSIVGPSGCGKSTLLSLLAGMIRPTQGEVRLFGEPLTGPSRRVGYMLQHDSLFEWRDVLHNVLIGAEVRGLDREAARRRALELLDRYGLGGFAGHAPKQLSGGMRQRVALIRTLLLDPDILLLDEPFSALDYQTRLSLGDEVAEILRDQGKTVVLVTHDIAEAITMADRVVVMSKRPATITAEHPIRYAAGRLLPTALRKEPEFSRYFNRVWEELKDHVRV